MKYFARISWLVIVLVLFTLAACGKGTPTAAPSDPNQVYTQIWETVVAGQTQTQAVAPPTQAATNTPDANSTPKSTNTPLISPTSSGGSASATPAVNNTPKPPAEQTCDNATFVTDVTYEDNSVVPAGQSFVKTWRIKNLGPCTWNQDYEVIYGWGGDGTNWNKNAPSHFSELVAPGEMIDVSIELDAPTEAGTYNGTFRTQNENGFNFGPTLTVVIVVK
jgi:predicted small lipoprotein YifL